MYAIKYRSNSSFEPNAVSPLAKIFSVGVVQVGPIQLTEAVLLFA